MKLPNGYGSVFRVKDRKLRNPWKVQVTLGWELKDDKSHRKIKVLGYYHTKQEGLEALVDYHNGKEPVQESSVTVRECFDRWWKEKESSLALLSQREYLKGWRKLSDIADRPITSLRVEDLEGILDVQKSSMRNQVKVIMLGIYGYAMRHEIVQKDYSKLIRSYSSAGPVHNRSPFSEKEIKALWKDGSGISHSVLVGIYSGWRWSELMTFQTDWQQKIMLGGTKTEAGKSRVVPIHHRIEPIIDDMYITQDYHKFRREFKQLMVKLGMDHTIHETRHTTATRLYGQDEHLVKLIMGHADKDITKGRYTHNTIEQLRSVIESMK